MLLRKQNVSAIDFIINYETVNYFFHCIML